MKLDGQNPKTQRTITILTVVLVILAGVVSSCIRGGQEEDGFLTFSNEGYLSVRDQAGTVTKYPYEAMTEVIFMEAMDTGNAVEGAVLEGTKVGIWNSSICGQYQACLAEEIPACILIRTDDGVCAINYESTETTKELYEAILRAREALAVQP